MQGSALLVLALLARSLAAPGPGHPDLDCVHLARHKELVCQCSRGRATVLAVPSLVTAPVESLKLEHCRELDLGLDLATIRQPFYQVRVEEVGSLVIRDIKLAHDGDLDIIVRNVRHLATVTGDITCVDCGHVARAHTGATDIRAAAQPTVLLQMKNVTRAHVTHVELRSVHARLSVRDAGNVRVDHSVLDTLADNAVEVWHADSFALEDTAVRRAADRCITLNHVAHVRVARTLGLANTSLDIVSPADTQLETLCMLLPGAGGGDAAECGGGSPGSFSARTGTIVLVAVCGLVVLAVILLLCILNKKGRLDNML